MDGRDFGIGQVVFEVRIQGQDGGVIPPVNDAIVDANNRLAIQRAAHVRDRDPLVGCERVAGVPVGLPNVILMEGLEAKSVGLT